MGPKSGTTAGWWRGPPRWGGTGPVMAPPVSCLLVAVLFSASCKATTSSDQTCTEKEANKTYNCENLGLREIPDTLPNTTEFLEFSFNFLPAIQNTTFFRLTNLIFLDLTRCQINWIHEDTFQSHHQLDTLVLTGNPLIFMAETSLLGPRALKHLFLIQTGISNLEFIPVHNLENLESLYLGSNYISSIKLPENFPTQNLKVLDFQNNALHFLSREDLNALGATNLSLNLDSNDIKGMEPGAFHAKVFQSLRFGGILDVSVILKGLQNSTTQSLWLGTYEDTESQDLTPAMLEGLCEMSVESISLRLYHFSDLSATTFRCFTRLRELDLTATHLKELPSGIQGMDSLKKLVLNVNHFEQLCQINAASFPALTDLYIKGNLKELDLGAGCLEKLENLRRLDLSHNGIKASDCCNLPLKSLHHLQHLNLSYAGSIGLQSQAFQESPKLEVLDLAFTHLTVRVPQSPFQNLPLLQALNLSHCLLDASNQHLLEGLGLLSHRNREINVCIDGQGRTKNLIQRHGSFKTRTASACRLKGPRTQKYHPLDMVAYGQKSSTRIMKRSLAFFGELPGKGLDSCGHNIEVLSTHILSVCVYERTNVLSALVLMTTKPEILFFYFFKEKLREVSGVTGTLSSGASPRRGFPITDERLTHRMGIMGACGFSVNSATDIIECRFNVKNCLRWIEQLK
ncbi:hypothetical protein QTO34_013924 [Cnephaeus nilssonii]|uniref:CD180 antigen n=1 Tax=Cnephaeus nilssonii TaxID=3371016 RepID=A0AA40I8V8_CNENI|nr:hypothetical protein QTO34_013924 [Eptesicus nilssonii]